MSATRAAPLCVPLQLCAVTSNAWSGPRLALTRPGKHGGSDAAVFLLKRKALPAPFHAYWASLSVHSSHTLHPPPSRGHTKKAGEPIEGGGGKKGPEGSNVVTIK